MNFTIQKKNHFSKIVIANEHNICCFLLIDISCGLFVKLVFEFCRYFEQTVKYLMVCYLTAVDFCTFQNFLLRVASHPILSFDRLFIGFLQLDEGWRDSIKDTGKTWQLFWKFGNDNTEPWCKSYINTDEERFSDFRK